MPKIKISSADTMYMATEGNSTYYLAKGETVTATNMAINSSGTMEGTRFEIDGRLISTGGSAIQWANELSTGKATSVEIGRSGRIFADVGAGVRLYGNDMDVDNAGKIDGYLGISVDGAGSAIRNSGTIDAAGIGVNLRGDTVLVNSGTIESDKVAVFLTAKPLDAGSVVRNSGTIEGSTAILGTALDERVTNSGDMSGQILLGGGNDTFAFKAGSSTDQAVEGSVGDDRYIVNVKGAAIAENFLEGFDRVKASVSYTLSDHIERIDLVGKADIKATGSDQGNEMRGNAGNNVLHGKGGMDILNGAAGNDRLFGDDGSDSFVFLKGAGRDTVMDFETGIDEILLGGLKGAKDFDNMLARHAEQKGDDVWITYGEDVVVLKNADADQLQAMDFNFG